MYVCVCVWVFVSTHIGQCIRPRAVCVRGTAVVFNLATVRPRGVNNYCWERCKMKIANTPASAYWSLRLRLLCVPSIMNAPGPLPLEDLMHHEETLQEALFELNDNWYTVVYLV